MKIDFDHFILSVISILLCLSFVHLGAKKEADKEKRMSEKECAYVCEREERGAHHFRRKKQNK